MVSQGLAEVDLSHAQVPALHAGIHVDCGFFALERTLLNALTRVVRLGLNRENAGGVKR